MITVSDVTGGCTSRRIRGSLVRLPLAATLGALLLVSFAALQPARADYRVAAGDVIDFSIAGVPDLKLKSPVDIDGKVTLPLAGSVRAAGMTVAELRASVAALLSQREFRQRGYNKAERDFISADEVMISISEYRPIYVNGDVSRPSSQPYRPGMTARQAVSLSGGYDLLKSRIEDPILQSVDLQGALAKAWVNFGKQLAHVRRLKAELGQSADNESKELAAIPVTPAVLASITQIEENQLRVGSADFRSQVDHLGRLRDQLASNRDIMAQRRDAESEGLQSDESEFQKIQDSFKRGLAPSTRIADARRIVLLSSVQSLQSAVELERSKTDLEKATQEVLKFGNARSLKLLEELRDANASVQALRSDIRAQQKKLAYVGTRKSLGRDDTTLDIVLVRSGRQQPASLETELQPGDVVEVKLSLGAPMEQVVR